MSSSSRLKVRIAKLFPKNGSVEEQRRQLSSTPFSIAVGTPHRLNALLSSSPPSSSSASDRMKGLRLDKTQLVVLDDFSTPKNYTVCTQPDTAPDCARFIGEFVLPQITRQQEKHRKRDEKRKEHSCQDHGLRIAFL